MAPVATDANATTNGTAAAATGPVKAAKAAAANVSQQLFNPFYSPDVGDADDSDYQYAKYKVRTQPIPRTAIPRLTCARHSRPGRTSSGSLWARSR